MSYNVEEGLGQNHFNCPVVAYYPQVLKANVPELKDRLFICDFVSIHERKEFVKHMSGIVRKYFPEIGKDQVKIAAGKAYDEYGHYLESVRKKAEEYISKARKDGKPIVVLCGRPYHVDPEVSHGIDELICSLGAVVVTEDSISNLVTPFRTGVMNQWSYHARMYAAAKYIAEHTERNDMQLVQLVSFGCGVDAVTTDEVRSILEDADRLYTQIKIDEISNMGAVKIRLRSLFSAAERKAM